MTTTVSKFRRHLAELNIWLEQIEQLQASLTDPRSTPSRTNRTRNPDTLPFNLDARIDNTDDGPQGVRTPSGAREILYAWAASVAKSHPNNDTHTYPIMNPITYLNHTAEWAHDHYPDWEPMAEEIDQLRHWAARLAGYGDMAIAKCPRCNGDITTTPTDNGIPEHGTCNTCDHWYANQHAISTERERINRKRITTITDPGTYLTLQTIMRHHPTLDRKTLNQWVRRGHVQKNQHGYQIAPINLRMGTIP